MNIADLFEANFKKHGDYEALVWENETWSSTKVFNEWQRLCELMWDLGIRVGDPIVILLPNVPEVQLVFPAVWKLGAVAAPIHYSYQPYEIEEILRTIAPAAVITTSTKAKALLKYLPANLDRRKIIVTGWEPGSEFQDFYAPTAGKVPETFDCDDADAAVIIFSSGTSGKPKGVIQSHTNIIWLTQSCQATEHAKESVMRPFFSDEQAVTIDFSSYAHTGRLFFFVLSYCRKQKTILRDGFDALSILKDIQKYKVNFFGGSPVAYAEICTHPLLREYDISSVKAWAYFAAPMSVEKSLQYEAVLGKRIYAVYGLSESVTLACCEPATPKRLQSVGLPTSGTKIKIIGAGGVELAPGEVGELCVSRKANAICYLDMPGETAKVFRREWVHTGDLARMDEDGYVYIVGRNSAMINQGGFKVIPGEVEAALEKMPAVEACAVAGLPDDLFGQVVGAFIKLRKGSEATTERDVVAHCRQFLSDNKIPRKIYFLDMLPRTKTAKVDVPRLLREAVEIDKRELEASGQGFAKRGGNIAANVEEAAKVVVAGLLDLPVEKIASDVRLTEMGMTSLMALEFSTELSKTIGHNLCSALTFNYPTLKQLANHVAEDIFGVKDGSTVKESGKTTGELAKNVVLAPELAWNEHVSPRAEDTGDIFVTGASGYFGAHLIDALSTTTQAQLICLVRASQRSDDHYAAREEDAKERLRSQLRAIGCDVERVMSRVSVVPGDVTLESFGLTEERFAGLAARVGVIYHSAAKVNHLLAYADLEVANVGGTREILKFAAAGREKRLHYASTIAVKVTRESGSPDHDRPLKTGYAQTKWVAEKLVALAKNRGLQASIFRMGQLCWNTETGIGNPTQLDSLVINALVVLKKHPPPEALASILPNITPIDYAVKAMVNLCSRPEQANGIFHLIAPKPTDWVKLVAAINEHCPLTAVSYEQWLEELSRRAGEFPDDGGNKLRALLGNTNRASGGFDYTCEETVAALQGSGVSFPEPWANVGVYLKRSRS